MDENDIGNVRVGQEAIFTVASYPGVEFKGKVTSIYPSATIQDNVVYYITTVSVDNRDEKLRPDMTADVSVYLDKRKGVLTVPNKALHRGGGKRFALPLLTAPDPEKTLCEDRQKELFLHRKSLKVSRKVILYS